MKAVLCWLALGAVPTFGQAGGGPIAPFALYTQFEHEPPPPVLDSVKEELSAIMGATRLRYEWRSLASADRSPAGGLAVVTFKGNCGVSPLFHDRFEYGALGWTYVTDGAVIPFSSVDCDLVRAFLSAALMHLRANEREGAFGRAIARVLAHELYHVIAETRHHGAGGVAEEAYSRDDLMAPRFAFAEADQRALDARLNPRAPGAAGDGPFGAGRSLFAESGCINCHGSRGEGASGGPSLRAAGRRWKAGNLAARLINKASVMYRRARDREALWHPLTKPDIESLVAYLNAAL